MDLDTQSVEEYIEKLADEFLDRVYKQGATVIVCVQVEDPIKDRTQYWYSGRGPVMTKLGLVTYAQSFLARDAAEGEGE